MNTNASRTRALIVGALASATFGWSALAQGQTAVIPQMALNRYEPAERGSEWFANESLDFRGAFRPAFGITGDYAHAPYVLLNRDGSENTVVIANTTYVHLGAAFVLFQRLRIGMSLPIAVAQDGNDKTVGGRSFVAPTKGGIGDLRIAADLRLLGEYGDPFTLAIGGRVWVPTGDATQYIGDGKPRIGPRLTFAGDIGSFVYAGGLGFVYRPNDDSFNGHPNGTEATFNAAIGVRLADKNLVLGPEIYGTTTVTESKAVLAKHTTPLALVLGGHYTAGSFRFGLGVSPGLTHTAGTPEYRGLLSLDYIPAIEPAPKPAVIVMEAPPADRDSDGILDKDDACPEVVGVKTSDPKTNGCPPDRDGDGVPDNVDACVDVAGMKTDDPKTNGCPSDGDADGVYDKDDACPAVAGVKTDDPKTNGCPPDRDGDGVVDAEDACPEVFGPKSNDAKANGCPLVFIAAGQVKILEQIKFKTNSAEIIGSQTIIDEVAKVLKDHPEVKHVRVQGHTDNTGTAIWNKDLSRKRADAVVAALVKAGVAKARLSSEGFGLEQPIADNSTEEGRTANRRVEFHIEGGASK